VIRLFTIFLIVSCVLSHDPNKEQLEWKQYYRIGSVFSASSNAGVSGYGRLKRTTKYTFRDIRFFGHFFNKDTEIRIRQKSSRQFLTFDSIYSFNTLLYEKNTILNVNLRYHYNQGLGWFMQRSKSGNMTLETGVAFDNSDYLNNQQKTTYGRGGLSFDRTMRSLSTKFEIDYYYQISEIVASSSLSRIQVLSELQWAVNSRIGLMGGFTWDIQEEDSDPSIFLTISFIDPLNWSL
tara:strand:- start:264 stop:971 length:708 start_codon:yes stop_codon:yes gene_type:complete